MNIPPFLTVEEAGRLLRIGRTKAYQLTKEWRDSGGRSGLPVVDLGDLLRVPGPAIERLLETGWCEAKARGGAPAAMTPQGAEGRAASPSVPGTKDRTPRRTTRRRHQLPLFEPATPPPSKH